MIDPKELRIWNLAESPTGWIGSVIELKSSFVRLYKKDDLSAYNFGSDLIEPIPITPKWLERFGFACDGNYCDIRIMGGYLRISDDIDECLLFTGSEYSLTVSMDYSTCEIHNAPKYVHQLQNLYFALTGQELKIKP